MFVKPKTGLKVRDPITRGFLPEAGAEVPASLYWTRRVRDGDVELVRAADSVSHDASKEAAK